LGSRREAEITVDAAVLAAGRATRMGRAKHLLRAKDVPMLQSVLAALRSSRVRRVVVVLREGDEEGRRLAESLGARAVDAEDADEGRAASVRAGLRALPEPSDGVLFALADQPYLETEDFDALIACFEEGDAGIVHAVYAGDRGSPVLFATRYRPELLALRGRDGGRQVIRRHIGDAAGVDLPPERGRDVDRPEDLR
jgi:molybdenum cofactor cytidylyltransferase